MNTADETFLARAIALSEAKMRANQGGPFGALVVRDGEVLGEGWNQVTSANDPTAHAEVMAIRAACRAIGDFKLTGAVLYTSCEPCPMCLASAYWARVERIVYANAREDAAAIGFDDAFLYDQLTLPITARSLPMTRLLPLQAKAVFDAWAVKPDKIAY